MTENIVNTQIDACMTCNRRKPLHTSNVETHDKESLSSDAVTGHFIQSHGRTVYCTFLDGF